MAPFCCGKPYTAPGKNLQIFYKRREPGSNKSEASATSTISLFSTHGVRWATLSCDTKWIKLMVLSLDTKRKLVPNTKSDTNELHQLIVWESRYNKSKWHNVWDQGPQNGHIPTPKNRSYLLSKKMAAALWPGWFQAKRWSNWGIGW